jgi:hypothetical protein
MKLRSAWFIPMALALTLACVGCGSSGSHNPGGNDDGGTSSGCPSANFNVLVGSCTFSGGLGCVEYYSAAAEDPTITTDLANACTAGTGGITGTWASSGCPSSIACRCSSGTSSTWRIVTCMDIAGVSCASTCASNCEVQE